MMMDTKPNTHECPYCGEIFEAKIVKGDPDEMPPCIMCAFEGRGPTTNKECKNA